MTNLDEEALKAEIDQISKKIDTIMKKVDRLYPPQKKPVEQEKVASDDSQEASQEP